MRKFAAFAVFCALALAGTGGAQELAPGVVLLARIKAKIREELANQPNYTCLETVTRFHKTAGGDKLRPLDRVQLEIVYSDHKEWYGSPGDRNLNVAEPTTFTGSGLMGNGMFATTLNNVVGGGIFTYRGEDTADGRTVARYDFQYPREPKGLEISLPGGAGRVGLRGTLVADAKTLDLVRLEARADDIPAYLPLSAESTAIEYTRTGVGDRSVLLPREGTMQLTTTSGVTDFDDFEFGGCRSYSAESSIRFDTADTGVAGSSAAAAVTVDAIPANQAVTFELTTPITDRDAVGQLISARVTGEIRRKGIVVVRSGAAVRGRIRRMERNLGNRSGGFIVGLEFTEVESAGGWIPFYADFLKMDAVKGVAAQLTHSVIVETAIASRTTTETITLAELPGVASFFVSGDSFTLAAGLHMQWRTRGPIRLR